MKTISKLAVVAALVGGLGLAVCADEFNSDGVRIHYVVEGKGEPLILIHGLYSSARMNPGNGCPAATRGQLLQRACMSWANCR